MRFRPTTRLALASAVAAGLIAVVPASALAGGSIPPTNSGAGQYVENVPGAGGNSSDSGKPANNGGGVPAPTQNELNGQGAAGQATAALAGATAPPTTTTVPAAAPKPAHKHKCKNGQKRKNGKCKSVHKHKSAHKHKSDKKAAPAPSTPNTGGGAVPESSSSGMSPVLPIILGLSLVAAIVFLVARRRGAGGIKPPTASS